MYEISVVYGDSGPLTYVHSVIVKIFEVHNIFSSLSLKL